MNIGEWHEYDGREENSTYHSGLAGDQCPHSSFFTLFLRVNLLFHFIGEHPDGYTDGSLWERYVWEGEVMNIESYVDTDREMSRAVFVPGVGCTINGTYEVLSHTNGTVCT
jgi:hypothetical protein